MCHTSMTVPQMAGGLQNMFQSLKVVVVWRGIISGLYRQSCGFVSVVRLAIGAHLSSSLHKED